MAKNTNRRKKDIKSKLLAAICMLLVSTIMMVSSTYAWFTLSTAPEVKGITTSIGSNGALEIALSPVDGDPSKVQDAGVLPSTTPWTQKNMYWGNMLDLKEGYSSHWEDLILNPAVLMAGGTDNNGTLNTSALLGTPVYGSDGRVSNITSNTFVGGWNATNDTPGTGYIQTGGQYGIRAVGLSSGMSAQQRDLMSALAAITTYAQKASTEASSSMTANGSALASMVVAHARVEGNNDENDYKDYVDELTQLVADLDKSVEAMQEAVRASLLAGATTVKDTDTPSYAVTRLAIQNALWEDTTDSESNTVSGIKTLAKAAGQTTLVDKIDAIIGELEAAQEALEKCPKNGAKVAWDDVHPVLNALMDTSVDGSITVNGAKMSEIKNKMTDSSFITGVMTYTNIKLGAGSGVYYDIAEVAGDITAKTTATVYVGMMGFDTVTLPNVVIETTYKTTAQKDADLTLLKKALSEGDNKITAVGASTNAPMDTFYGYVIDLMFRTNAADSKLLLQTDATQRVYGEGYDNGGASGNEETMGGGAAFTFTGVANTELSSVMGMLEALRVVFFDPTASNNNTIYGIAKVTNISSTVAENGTNTVTGSLQLCNYKVEEGVVVVGDAKSDDNGATTSYDDGAVICDLIQNTAKAVSALVYLDGAHVTNADVLYNKNIVGALNLQFASSVVLQPMHDSELYNGETVAP